MNRDTMPYINMDNVRDASVEVRLELLDQDKLENVYFGYSGGFSESPLKVTVCFTDGTNKSYTNNSFKVIERYISSSNLFEDRDYFYSLEYLYEFLKALHKGKYPKAYQKTVMEFFISKLEKLIDNEIVLINFLEMLKDNSGIVELPILK